ncbi:19078_t:CDS:2, partial [Funneliformis geosporum]
SSNDSLADDLVSGTNDSDINNLVRRQPHHSLGIHAGFRAWVDRQRNSIPPPIDDTSSKQCTLGFAVRQVSGIGQFEHGFLTLGSCMSVSEQVVYLGAVSSLRYAPTNDDGVSDDMIVNNAGELEMVAVSNQPYPQAGLTANQELLVVPLIVLGHEIPLELQWSPKDTFQNLIKV